METKTASRQGLGTIFCVVGALCWGFSAACSEAFFRAYPVDSSWVTAVRMTASGIILVIWSALRRDSKISAALREGKSVLQILAFAFLGLTFCQFSYLNAIRWSNSGTAAMLQSLSIVFIALFVCISSHRVPSKRTAVCILLALMGVWLITTGGSFGAMKLTPRGLVWGLCAGLGAASYTLLSRRPVERWGSATVTGIGMLLGGLVLSLSVGVWHIPSGLDIRALLLLGLIILVGTVGAFSVYIRGISIIGPVRASLIGCLEPLTATALSALWLGTRFELADILGFACILATVLLTRKG